jgi:hypothetical protein
MQERRGKRLVYVSEDVARELLEYACEEPVYPFRNLLMKGLEAFLKCLKTASPQSNSKHL